MNLLMTSVRGMGVSQLEMTFCDIHTCDLGKGLVKVRNLCIQQQVPRLNEAVLLEVWLDLNSPLPKAELEH